MGTRKKLLAALDGFEPFTPEPGDNLYTFQNVSTGNSDPPAYIVAFLFLNILGYPNYGSAEKVWWHTYFRYKGNGFLLRDFKFGSWSLEVSRGVSVPDSLVGEVVGKIKSGSAHADGLLKKELRKQVQTGNFWIQNGYHLLRAAFDFYFRETRNAQRELDDFQAQGREPLLSFSGLTDYANERIRLERVLAYRVFPLIVAFFSLLEFLLDALFAFERPAMNFLEFRKLSWQDRFKMVIPLLPGGDILKAYESLVRVKAEYRNPLAHGLTNQSSLLLPVRYGGLVPVSVKHLSSSVHFGIPHIPATAAVNTVQMFDMFLRLISDTEPYAYYMRFLDSGFSIPIAQNEIEAIRSKMTSTEEFEEYIRRESMYHDAIINRDI